MNLFCSKQLPGILKGFILNDIKFNSPSAALPHPNVSTAN